MDVKLDYYLEVRGQTIFAHDKRTEFFELYLKDEQVWRTSPISFMAFQHDYCDYQKLTESEVRQLTNDHLPTQEYLDYLKIFNRHLK